LWLLGRIPQGVLSGLFLYMGYQSFIHGNQFFERVLLLITDKNLRPPFKFLETVSFKIIALYTIIQFTCWAITLAVTVTPTPAAISFPVFIFLLVPFQRYLMPKILSSTYIKDLDSDETLGSEITEEPPIDNIIIRNLEPLNIE